MNTIEYLNLAKTAYGVTSDYALAQKMGVTRSYISRFMSGKMHLTDEMCLMLAPKIGVHAGLMMLDMHRLRSNTPVESTVWQEIYQGFLALLMQGKDRRAIAR